MVLVVVSQHWPLPMTLTSLFPLCSPDEDSCQKFVPFVGVSVVWGQRAAWAMGGGTVQGPAGAAADPTCLSSQVVKVGLVEQSFSASGGFLGAHSYLLHREEALAGVRSPHQPTLFLLSGFR